MPRQHAHLLTSVWSDPAWVALSQGAQHTYWLLLSQPKLNMVGLLTCTPSRWSRLAADTPEGGQGAPQNVEGETALTAHTTLVGNLVSDPDLKFTPSGTPLASFSLAVNRRWKGSNDEWQEAVSFFQVTAWRDLANNISDTLEKGARVIVTGRLEQQTWETDGGEKRSKVQVVADDVGPSLRWATAEVVKSERRKATEEPRGDSWW